MANYRFETWCRNAIALIRFPPDQKAVLKELYDHMEDHYDALVAQGLGPEEAESQTLEAMGSAEEIAPQLAAIHRPFWGYFLRVTRAVLLAALCAAVILAAGQLLQTRYHNFAAHDRLDPFGDTVTGQEGSTFKRIFYEEPMQSVQSDGYTITLTKAAIWHTDEPGAEDDLSFYFQMEVFNPRPWAAVSDTPRWFWAVDSLGNAYDCYYEGIHNFAPYIAGNGYHTGPLTYTHDMWISDYRSEDAEWIEFHYDRDGRDLVLRLNLAGGDTA